VQLSSFTETVIILNLTVGSGWNFTWSLLTCWPTLVSNFRSIGGSRRHHKTGQQRLYEFCYLLSFDLWTSYLAKILFLKGCDSLFWESSNSPKIFNGLQHSFHVWQGFINVSESFSYLFILATKRKEDFRLNSTFR